MKMKKLHITLLLTVFVLLLFLVGCTTTPTGEITQENRFPQPQQHALVKEEQQQTSLAVDLYILGNEFSPSVIVAQKDQLVQLTIANGRQMEDVVVDPFSGDVERTADEIPFDLSIPAFGIETQAYIADEISFVADKTGTFEFYCIDCSPQLVGTIVVN
jgi:hypothetical protein